MSELRVRIPDNLIEEYKIFCIENKLSVPKQTVELIRKFLEIQKQNTETMRKIRRN